MENLPKKLIKLIEAFQRFPGVGYKSAERMAFTLLEMNVDDLNKFISSVEKSKEIVRCSSCFNFSDEKYCKICLDSSRENDKICVVSHPKDIIAIEKGSFYNGQYFVLNKLISPSKGFLPSDLNIDILINKSNNYKEIILALNTSLEGETTSLFLQDLFKDKEIKISVLGYGLPMGSSLEYSDEITIAKSFENRKEIKK